MAFEKYPCHIEIGQLHVSMLLIFPLVQYFPYRDFLVDSILVLSEIPKANNLTAL